MTRATAAPGGPQLTQEQAYCAADVNACAAVREALRGRSLAASLHDPDALARVALALIDVAVAVIVLKGQETGRSVDEARADGIAWLDAHASAAELRLLEAGATWNPYGSAISLGGPEVITP